MQVRRILVSHGHIAEELPASRDIIKSANLMETLNTIDRGDYGFTIRGLQMLEVLEMSLAVFMEVAKQLTNLMGREDGGGFARIRELSGDDIRFLNLYSLFVTSVEAIEGCTSICDNLVKVSGTFKTDEVKELAFTDTSILPRKLLKDYQSYLKFYREHKNPAKRVNSIGRVIERTIGYFKLLKNSVEKILADSAYDIYRESIEETHVNLMGKVFDGFHYSAEDFSENSQLMPVGVNDIIGNQEYLKAAVRLARDVAGFDFVTWENPKQINPVLFAMGSPGCGKTVTAHAVGNYFLDFCKQRGIRSRFVIIRRTDWASSYQNASAKQLIDIFKRNILDFKGVVGVYWPDIDTAFAARGDSGIRNEEKNVLGAVFGLFDGTILPKNGQWFMMTDANYLNMDKATISRITQDPYYVKGPEVPADFVALFRDVKLRKHRQFMEMTDDEWEQFGRLCIDNKLSGRSVENMARKAVTIIEDFDYPDEYFTGDIQKKKEIIREYSKILKSNDLQKLVGNYVEFQKGAEEKAAKKRFQERVNEIINYLSAQKLAQETLMMNAENSLK